MLASVMSAEQQLSASREFDTDIGLSAAAIATITGSEGEFSGSDHGVLFLPGVLDLVNVMTDEAIPRCRAYDMPPKLR